MRQTWAKEAEALYLEGDLEAARARALHGLEERPGDIDLLRMAGRCSLELDSDDAADYFGRLVALAPDDVDARHDLALAHIGDGRLVEAAQAFRQVLAVRPDDLTALVNLAHVRYALGEKEEARSMLTDVVDRNPENIPARRSLVEMLRALGEVEASLELVRDAARRWPEDVLTVVDLADLQLSVGGFDGAVAAYYHLREVDESHEVYAWHGMIEVEIRRERWRRALDLVIEATRLDRQTLTTELLAYIAARLFGEGSRPGYTWDYLQVRLAAERAEHRRMHSEALAW
ncbi:MAG: hypothetical protein QOH66_2487 [Actinomycetota bacterium]|jgi:tetratricopeptide (TPR) repeat protein|nr:hypothetical protein [Actinomycetota bacterium]